MKMRKTNKFIIFVVLLTAPNECYHYHHCLPDGPCIVTINVYVRSISKISDLDMVSPLMQPKKWNYVRIYSESFVRVHRVTVQPTNSWRQLAFYKIETDHMSWKLRENMNSNNEEPQSERMGKFWFELWINNERKVFFTGRNPKLYYEREFCTKTKRKHSRKLFLVKEGCKSNLFNHRG